MTDPLKNVIEAAEWLGIPPRSLEAMVTANRVPHTRIGKHVRFAQEHLDAIVAAGERRPASTSAALLRLATPAPAPKPSPARPTPPARPAAPATPPPPTGPKQNPSGKQVAA
jgi:excisionase family DNA binding protein